MLVLVAAVFALRKTVWKPEPLEVQAVAAARGQVEETVTNSRAGTIKALRRAQISPEVGGRAVDVPHRKGDRVTKGDVLLRLDPSVLDARVTLSRRELQAAQAQRDQACANAERSRRELGRLSRLAKDGIIRAPRDRGARGDHGPVGLRQVDPPLHARLPRPPGQRLLLAGWPA